jgi:multisubunit Na+/H+ antiporter MnhB subunit
MAVTFVFYLVSVVFKSPTIGLIGLVPIAASLIFLIFAVKAWFGQNGTQYRM